MGFGLCRVFLFFALISRSELLRSGLFLFAGAVCLDIASGFFCVFCYASPAFIGVVLVLAE